MDAAASCDPEIALFADMVRGASSALFITGAGISADSGLPTYRGVGGLYEQETTPEGVPIEAALSGAMMRSRPELCWKYIHQIESACRGAAHNRAHEVIARLERSIPRLWVLTQNVDGFHRAAGSTRVIEIHGNLGELRCTDCDHTWRVADYAALEVPPRCSTCRGVVRPQVVLFGELLPSDAVRTLEVELRRGFDLVVTVGTSSAFPYIAQPVLDARARGTATVEVNPAVTDLSGLVDLHVQKRALSAFEALSEALGASPSTAPPPG